MKWTVRPATPADLEHCAPLMVAALNDLNVRVGQPPSYSVAQAQQPAWWQHLLATSAGFWIAETDEMIGFANCIRREDEWFLTHLFVAPAVQSQGVGRDLLDACWTSAIGAEVRAVVAGANNLTSTALYARHGLRPQVPLMSLTRTLDHPHAWGADVPTIELEVWSGDNLDWLAQFDRTMRGHARPEDHSYLISAGFVLHRCIAEATTVGYLYTAPWGQVGPAVGGPKSITGAVAAALAKLQAEGCASARIYVPGPATELLSWLLQHGFQHTSLDLYCADTLRGDWRCYVPFRAGLP